MKYSRDNITGLKFVHKNEPNGAVYSIDFVAGDKVYIGNFKACDYSLPLMSVLSCFREGTWLVVDGEDNYEIF